MSSSIMQMEYFYDDEDKNRCPLIIRKPTPIQMPSLDIDDVKVARANFTDESDSAQHRNGAVAV